jgi:hypothetical protein
VSSVLFSQPDNMPSAATDKHTSVYGNVSEVRLMNGACRAIEGVSRRERETESSRDQPGQRFVEYRAQRET